MQACRKDHRSTETCITWFYQNFIFISYKLDEDQLKILTHSDISSVLLKNKFLTTAKELYEICIDDVQTG